MKVLTLHQPWASLVALGVKTIETRSWSTQYRGPLAIHAAATMPSYHKRYVSGATASKNGWEEWRLHFSTAPSAPMPRGLPAPPEYGAIDYPLPLGAIVAICTLVDVVPMKAHTESTTDHAAHLLVGTRNDPDRLLLARPSKGFSTSFRVMTDHFEWATEIVTDQRPYGLFEPGRYAFLLADVVPVDPPVPFKGGQGLTKTWEPVMARG